MEAREHSSSNRLPPIVVDKNKEISPILNQIEENYQIYKICRTETKC
jgi:hypothetical protein